MSPTNRYGGAILSTLSGIADLFRSREPAGRLRPDDRIDGANCLVTGASSGLGFAVACELLRRGGRVIVTGRTADTDLEQTIRERVSRTGEPPGENVVTEKIDLLEFSSVDEFVNRLAKRGERLDISVFNAGAVTSRHRLSADGYDVMLQTNYLAKYLLVRKLVETECIRPGTKMVPRLVFVSSEAHRSSKDINPESFMTIEPYTMGGSMGYYGYSKLLLTAFTEELSRRLNGGRVNASVFALCPGAVNSRIAREAPAFVQPLLSVVFGLFFRSPARAAEPVTYLACSPDVEGEDGVYLHMMNRKEKDPRALDPEFGRRLWEESERLLKGRF